MRPKIVALTLVLAIGLVALAAVLKGVIGGRASDEAKVPEPAPAEPARPTSDVQPVRPNSKDTAAMLEQMRVAEVEKELDQIRELQSAGSASQYATETLLHKTTHHEPEVRKASVEALVQLNATNAVPGLEQAVSLIEDPREKVVFMDAVAYLKLPGVTDGTAPELADAKNYPPSATNSRPVVPNPKIQRGAKKKAGHSGRLLPGDAQPAAAANPSQTQPAASAPNAAPPTSTAPDAAPATSPAPDAAPPQ
jgi:hypothetical protein